FGRARPTSELLVAAEHARPFCWRNSEPRRSRPTERLAVSGPFLSWFYLHKEPSTMSDRFARRDFLKSSAATLALSAPAILKAQNSNEKMNIGWIGGGTPRYSW